MPKHLLHLPAMLLWLSSAVLSPAQQAEQDLFKQVIGHWVVDLEAANTQAFIAALNEGVPPEHHDALIEDIAATTFEFNPGQMVLHEPDSAQTETVTVKSQDHDNQLIFATFQSGDEEPVPTTLHIAGDSMTLSAKDPDGQELSFDMKRIDAETFEKRVSNVADDEKPLTDQDEPANQSDDD